MSRVDELLRKKKLLEAKKSQLERELPHLHRFKFYKWSWDFFKSRNKVTLLCAANQIGKSSTQIRRMIDWATDHTKWEDLWPNQVPNIFWYFYPSKPVATTEFHKKWKEFLPQGAMKESEDYGWDAVFDKKEIDRIDFRSGVSIYFKTYSQNVMSLQSSTVFAVACDEELPENYYEELKFRLAATDGYFSMAFTATIGQELWWRAMECVGKDSEFLPDAKKIQVSMYDCLEYRDGSPTPWTNERIEKIANSCSSKDEVLRRIYGRFVKEGGKKYHAFDPSQHYQKTDYTIIRNWNKYCAVDIGSGGSDGHPSAIAFVAVSPDYTRGIIYRVWRGDGIQTTAGDVYTQFLKMKGDTPITRKWYDFASADFNAITTRLGDPFEKANKSHDLGESLINTLFSNNMLTIFDEDENRKLGAELISLQKSTPKTKAKDDLCDALRYCVVEIPWNLTHIKGKEIAKKDEKEVKFPQNAQEWNEYHNKMRSGALNSDKKDELSVESELDFWNDMY